MQVSCDGGGDIQGIWAIPKCWRQPQVSMCSRWGWVAHTLADTKRYLLNAKRQTPITYTTLAMHWRCSEGLLVPNMVQNISYSYYSWSAIMIGCDYGNNDEVNEAARTPAGDLASQVSACKYCKLDGTSVYYGRMPSDMSGSQVAFWMPKRS